MLIDSHCHLDYFTPMELPLVLERARAAGVAEMVTIGTTMAQSEKLPAIAEANPGIWCTVGVHPHHAAEAPIPEPETLAAMTRHPRVIGIGESGLDYFYDRSPRDTQAANFRANIRAAQLANVPLAIHARDADDDVATILREETDRGGAFALLLHCFSSTRALAEAALALGGFISFSGILTFPRSAELREIARDVPLDRLLVETDSPYLAPVPFRGKRNEPGYVAHTAKVLAEVKGMTLEALADLTTANFRRLFRENRMRVTLLGTGGSAGVPTIGGADGSGDWGECDPNEPRNRRTRSSIVIENTQDQVLLIDVSPDMREQFLTNRVRRTDAVLFTHAHADHISGLDDVRILNRIAQRPLEALATRQTLETITARFNYAFAPWDGRGFYRPVLTGKTVSPGETVPICGMDVRLFSQGHGRIETLGLRIGPFGYSTDVVSLNDAAFEALAGVDTWVVGCFLRHDTHWTHANLPTVLEWVARLQPRRTVLTHMGTDMDWGWLRENLPAGVEAGYDGMVLELPEG